MNRVPFITRGELEILYVPQIKRFAQYYGIEVDSKMRKSDIVDLILEASATPKNDSEQVQRSVRVQRIYEANKEK